MISFATMAMRRVRFSTTLVVLLSESEVFVIFFRPFQVAFLKSRMTRLRYTSIRAVDLARKSASSRSLSTLTRCSLRVLLLLLRSESDCDDFAFFKAS